MRNWGQCPLLCQASFARFAHILSVLSNDTKDQSKHKCRVSVQRHLALALSVLKHSYASMYIYTILTQHFALTRALCFTAATPIALPLLAKIGGTNESACEPSAVEALQHRCIIHRIHSQTSCTRWQGPVSQLWYIYLIFLCFFFHTT